MSFLETFIIFSSRSDKLYTSGSYKLCLQAKEINWDSQEKEFPPIYGSTGRPSVPIRAIVGLLILKQMYNLGDETIVEQYLENPYWKHFCRKIYFQNPDNESNCECGNEF